MCGTCLGGFLRDVAFDVDVMPVGGDWQFNGGGGSFFLQCGTCTVDLVHIDDKLLCDRDVVVENVLARYVIEIVLECIS